MGSGGGAQPLTRGERNIVWIETYCRVPEGKLVGQPVRLRPWQREIVLGIYDRPTRRAIISFGRKNGKTALACFLVLLHLCGPEALPNSAIYSAAQARDQAAIVFTLAAKVVRQNPDLDQYVGIKEASKQLVCPELGTEYRALSAEASTAYGLSPVFVVHDELGQVRGPRSELYEALETASGAQESPLSVVISTQAPNPDDLLSLLIKRAQDDPEGKTRLFLWTCPEDLDPFTEDAIKLANPAYGDFLNADEALGMMEEAKALPAREPAYRNLILNQRIDEHAPIIPRALWDRSAADYKLAEFYGQECWVGLDLSGTTDLTAMVLVFRRDRLWWAWPFFWLPKDGLAEKARVDHVPYDTWASQGHLLTTPGAAIDQLYVAKKAAEIAANFKVRTVAYDRAFLKYLQPQLDREGVTLPMQEFGQGWASMTPALNNLETRLLNGELRHPKNPVLTHHAACAVARKVDHAGNRVFDKAKSNGRIDGIVSLAMALSVAAQAAPAAEPRIRWV